jgi:riboflavin transporter FmnP
MIAVMGLFTAIGVVLSFIEIPLLGGTSFLKYDAANVPAALGGIAYGAGPGVLIGIALHGIHGLIAANPIGSIMNIAALLAFMLPVVLLCRKEKSTLRLIVGLVIGSILTVAAMIIMNLLITPFYMGVPFEQVVNMIIPILLPFNILKAILNSVLTFVLYKSLQKLLER